MRQPDKVGTVNKAILAITAHARREMPYSVHDASAPIGIIGEGVEIHIGQSSSSGS